jgi:hypothetical protein
MSTRLKCATIFLAATTIAACTPATYAEPEPTTSYDQPGGEPLPEQPAAAPNDPVPSEAPSDPLPGPEEPTASEPEPPAAEVRAPATSAEVLAVVSHLNGLEGWTVIPLAHFRRGSRHALVVWPAINSRGQLVDATVVGVPLEQGDDGALSEAGSRWVVREEGPSRASLVSALGGADWEVVDRGEGLPLDQLGPGLGSLAAEFSQAVAAGRRPAALEAAVAFSRLLPVERAGFESSVARLLWMASAHSAALEHQVTQRQGDRAQLIIRVVRGSLAIRTITATAAPVEGHPDRWVVESYQE